ncbi:DUF2971 domain-containing protein [Obesumbacterium proteus]|uniref:DUF2971 domain-containing protein n=1 Tax=Obesumbacterium proteus TaxID=82983 RepID=UPI00242AFD82|nr:DUF2971 domain-containing protein [Obesumbacterium proteus]
MMKRVLAARDPKGELKNLKNFKARERMFKQFDSEALRKRTVKGFAITCFSKSSFILPMWAHYADNHSGCVLTFAVDQKVEEDIRRKFSAGIKLASDDSLYPLDVIYDNIRPAIYNEDGLTLHDGTPKLFLNKAKVWSYEEEVRCVKHSSSGVYDYKRSPLQQVYFGLKMEDKHKRSIKDALERNKKLFGVSVKTFDVIIDLQTYQLHKC